MATDQQTIKSLEYWLEVEQEENDQHKKALQKYFDAQPLLYMIKGLMSIKQEFYLGYDPSNDDYPFYVSVDKDGTSYVYDGDNLATIAEEVIKAWGDPTWYPGEVWS